MKNSRHPTYNPNYVNFRLTYEAGSEFIEEFLEEFSDRESTTQFETRKRLSYVPAYAKSNLNEIRDSIYTRLIDINRTGGSESYLQAVESNIDLQGSNMKFFVGSKILTELLSMGRVGVFVDMPAEVTPEARPYVYLYKAEDILNWSFDSNLQLKTVLLRTNIEMEDEFGLTDDYVTIYRLITKNETSVTVQDYDEDEALIASHVIEIDEIPFVIFDIGESLLANVWRQQVALLNLASSDLSYSLRSNFPFYTEQYDKRLSSEFRREEGTEEKEIQVGAATGRRYPLNAERPGFIHPSSEPLSISMEKQEQIKQEIRELMHLALSTISAKMASQESKEMDMQGLESGLAFIGLVLEYGEQKISNLWAKYEGKPAAIIKYPTRYSLKTDSERLKEATDLEGIKNKAPSQTFKREICKSIATLTIGHKVPLSVMEQIYKEIDEAKVLDSDPKIIGYDMESGILDAETASTARGYPSGTVAKAKQDLAERQAAILTAQSNMAARGVPELGGEAKDEKQNTAGRGEGRLNGG